MKRVEYWRAERMLRSVTGYGIGMTGQALRDAAGDICAAAKLLGIDADLAERYFAGRIAA